MMRSIGAKAMAFPTPLWCVGSYDLDGKPNVMTAAWGGICCSKPPMITVSLQRPRHSFEAILKRKAYTVSVPGEEHVRQADWFGMVSGKNTDKFAVSGLTPVPSELVDAPYVGEFPLVIECELERTVELGAHIQFIGLIKDVKAREDILNQDGKPDMALARPVVFGPEARNYHVVGKLLGAAFSMGKDVGA